MRGGLARGFCAALAFALLPVAESPAQGDAASLAGRVTLDLPGATLAQLRPVVVHLEPLAGGQPTPAPRRTPRIHQRKARFSPSFGVVAKGQTVEMVNDDAIFHNVFSYSRPNDFDLGLYPAGQSRSVTFEHPGVVRTYCSIHESMNGLIFVAPSPHFDVVRPDGSFEIRGVPPGRYRVGTWCEKLPATSREVRLDPGARLSLEIPLAPEGR